MKRVDNVHPKFPIIGVNFEFLVELATQGGEETESNF